MLSAAEIEELKKLFRFLFAENEFGYTLLGDKPISFCFIPTGQPHIATKDHIFKIYTRGDRSFVAGYLAWNKLNVTNIFEKYQLIFLEEKNLPTFALIINKDAFPKLFKEHIHAFRKYYAPNITSEAFLEDLSKKEIVFGKLFSEHYLLGLLLGYGEQNSALFQRRNDLLFPKFRIPFSLDSRPNKGFSSVKEELDFLNQRLKPVSKITPFIFLVNSVNFAGDLTLDETQILKKKYEKLHEKLTMIFLQANWLDILLDQF